MKLLIVPTLLLSLSSCVTSSRPIPTLPNVSLGAIETVVNWTTSHCNCSASPGCTDPNDPDYTDTPPRAYVSSDNVLHLWSTDAQSRQATRRADAPEDPFFHNCSVHAASHFNCLTSAYNFQTWLHSPYMMADGINAFAFTHMEYHGWSCLGNSSCSNNNGGDCANEAIQLFVSSNGGWDWQPSDGGQGPPSNLVALSPYTYEYSRDFFNHSELGFGDPSSIVFDNATGAFTAIIAAANPPIGDNSWSGVQERGQCIIHSTTPTVASSWRAWDGLGFNVAFVDPYQGPVANYSAHACKPVNSSMIIVNIGWSVYFNKWVSSGFGSFTYGNGTEIPCCGAFLYSVSSDLINWDTPQLIRPCQQEGVSVTWEYDPALLDEAAWTERGVRNLHESIGQTASLFFWQQDETGRGRSIKRQTISFGP
jgi:hypothetical protein